MPRTSLNRRWLAGSAAGVAVLTATVLAAVSATSSGATPVVAAHAAGLHTSTPIKHVVVIFGENISFDHYFGTYPNATNTDGTPFHALPGTPKVNGLTPDLLANNPNLYDPKRLSPSQAMTCDQNHGYGAEQRAYDNGRVDAFVQNTENDKCTGQPILFGEPGLVMDYYDGNTVTAMWNYAQHGTLSDNSYDSVYGPSSPGAINLVSGQTHGIYAVDPKTGAKVSDSYVVQSPDANGVGTMINDPDPAFDDCSDANHTSSNNLGVMTGKNVGDLLNDRGVTWGWFQGKPTGTSNGYSVCGSTHANVGGNAVVDYSPHHEPFQYYKSTSNPKHLPPSSVRAIGATDQANHQYDLTDFDAALNAGNLPAVSFLKGAAYQDGHAGNSDPLDEQHFVVNELNKLQRSKEWKSTAVILAYDDSDGWYDHVMPPVVNGSHDASQDSAACTSRPAAAGQADRCGYGPRLPLLVVSPYSRANQVVHNTTDQSSITRFIEDNWHLGRIAHGSFDTEAGPLTPMFDFRQHPHTNPLILDPTTGAVTGH